MTKAQGIPNYGSCWDGHLCLFRVMTELGTTVSHLSGVSKPFKCLKRVLLEHYLLSNICIMPYEEDEESYYSEESYYEEVEEEDYEETVASPPAPAAAPARPVHPLFGGAGAKNALAAAAKNMDKKRASNPSSDPRPSGAISAAPAPSGGGPAGRPPHPLFGGGGPGASLNDQIMAKANQRNNRVNKEGAQAPAPRTTPPPPPSNPMAGGSLADQVAMMAARRNNRVNESGEAPQASEAPRGQPVSPPVRPATDPTPAPKTNYVRRVQPVQPVSAPKPAAPKPAAPKPAAPKSAARKPAIPKPAAPKPAVVVSQPSARTNTTPPAPKTQTFQKAQLRSVDSAHSSTTSSATPPAFMQAKLRPTGKKLDLAPPQDGVDSTAKQPVETNKVIRRETPAVEAGPSQSITRVTKSDPTYEIVEYKCYCAIM